MKSDIIRIGGLWKKKSKKGQEYLTGSFGPFSRVLILVNNDRRTENDPEYYLCIAPKMKKKEQKENNSAADELLNVKDKSIITAGAGEQTESTMMQVAETKNGEVDKDDDLPF